MRAAVGDDRGTSTLSKEDGEGLAENHGALWATLQILEPRDRLPATAQGPGDVLGGWDSQRALVGIARHKNSPEYFRA
jgi:hypothetical protein